MPTYHYACSTCSHEFDQYQSFTEDALSVCPSCEGFIRRVIQPVGVVFKGTGWYLTDSRKPDKSESSKESAPDGSTDTGEKAAAKQAADKPASTPAEPAAKKADAVKAAKSVESKPAATTAS